MQITKIFSLTGWTQVPVGYQWTAVITAVQSDSSVSGTRVTSVGGGGQVTGSISGDNFNMTIAETSPCIGTYNGVGMVNGNQISGTYSGTDCYGTLQASFTGSKR